VAADRPFHLAQVFVIDARRRLDQRDEIANRRPPPLDRSDLCDRLTAALDDVRRALVANPVDQPSERFRGFGGGHGFKRRVSAAASLDRGVGCHIRILRNIRIELK
jgi:hypothetical protein